MTDLRKAAEQALEALESAANNEGNFHDYKYAANALRQALDHVPEPDMGIDRGAWDDVPDATKWVDELRGGDETEQEPVAWRNAAIRLGEDLYSVGPDGYYDMTAEQWLDWALSVVTATPSKPWVSLTDEEIWEWFESNTAITRDGALRIARAIEAKLKEKNT